MQQKKFKTHRQLLSILRSRGMNIKTGSAGSRAMHLLEKENYYNIVNGYKDLFIQTPASDTTEETYKTGTSFDELFALYTFDREIRMIYLKYILKLENNFKTVVSHSFSEKYGHDNYLKLCNFQVSASTDQYELALIARKHGLDIQKDRAAINRLSTEENIANVTKLLGDIQQEISRQMQKHHQVITHYMTHHGYIPLWVLVNILTFGKVTTFYRNLKETDKIDIAKQFHINYKELHKYMTILGLARNICAHDERFFDIRFSQRLHTKSIKNFAQLKLPRDKSGSFVSGTNDAYAIAIIFSQMLTPNDMRHFIGSMEKEINVLSKSLKTIQVDSVLNRMGYPPAWKQLMKLVK